MKYLFLFLIIFKFTFCFSQDDDKLDADTLKKKSLLINHDKDKVKAKIDQYRIISYTHDTTFVDTSLTIQKEYKFNYLRKDTFGLLPFANEGQTYNTLNFGLNNFSPFPEIGFKAKQFSFIDSKSVKYYSVATPFTELYYKSVMEQGQTLDALITLNTSERLNFSIAYKGLRSLGKYINQLSSTGNFVFTLSYSTKENRYKFNSHYTGQDILNGENGGIIDLTNFTSGDKNFINRARVSVFFTDAKSFLKGKRFFLDQQFRINPTNSKNNLFLNHQFEYENKFFEFFQGTISTQLGTSYLASNLKDQTHYNKMYNKFGLQYENENFGKFQFFAEDYRNNSYYDKILILNNQVIPSAVRNNIISLGGQYDYRKNDWNGNFIFSKAISKQTTSNLEANLKYNFNNENQIAFQIQNISKLPDNNYTLYQSNYISYNWYNSFKNEKINNLKIDAKTHWLNASIQFSTLTDHLYFSNNSNTVQLVSPKQYDKVISYISFQANKEFKFQKFAIDNTILYQNVNQKDNILNVPQIVTRNTVYYSNFFFQKALYIQTGLTLNYFTKYYANNYNPVIGEFFVQNTTKIGDYPTLDFFINGRIRQTRIFLKAEHFNSGFSPKNYLTAPNYPYRDFMIRFGLVWDFFQ